jgi:glyoxylase-like metal-dependent hydrolase (beta-lactamase superfamily II)
MRVFPLHIGDTKVPFQQFYFGPWRGWWALPALARDPRRIIVPIYAYLIEHPGAGLILVDAGLNWDMAHAHRRYYPGRLARIGLEEDEYQLTREQELSAHLNRLGYRLGDIETVILTHLHEDHLGELRSLPHANIVMSADSWDEKVAFQRLRDFSPSFPAVSRSWQLIPYSSGPFHSFKASQDLLGDGRIVLLPTPGHAAGHMAVLIVCDGYQLLLAGDAIYSLRHMAVDQVVAITVGRKAQMQQIASIRRLHELREALPDLVLVPCHDHTAYQRDHLVPFLIDGTLSPEERRTIRSYEAQLFDAPWHLSPYALPQFLAAADGSSIGQVSEPTNAPSAFEPR